MKKLLLIAGIMTAMFTLPAYGQDDKGIIAEEITVERFEKLLPTVTDMYTKYTTTSVNIRSAPSLDSEIMDTTVVNTSVDVVVEIDDWAMITTEDGYAYMRTDWFSDTEIEIPVYAEDDLYILAHVLAGECQSYPDDEQRYVGSVVLNRVTHSSFPNNIRDVVFQKGQYACTWDGNYYREPTDRNWENARWLLENGSILPSNVVYQSSGKQGKGIYLTTKWHKYCY